MRKIQYDNFRTIVEARDVEVVDPRTPEQAQVIPMKLLVIVDEDGSTIHEFAYPLEHAKRLGEELGAEPKPRIARATPADVAGLASKPGGPIVGR